MSMAAATRHFLRYYQQLVFSRNSMAEPLLRTVLRTGVKGDCSGKEPEQDVARHAAGRTE